LVSKEDDVALKENGNGEPWETQKKKEPKKKSVLREVIFTK